MKQPKTIGLIMNPFAGKGFVQNAPGSLEILKHFEGIRIITGPGQTGEEICSKTFNRVEICPCNLPPSRAQTIELSRRISAEHDIDLLLVIGGDGTLADAAFALIDHPNPPPILGIGAGSTNVGPLVTCRLEDYRSFSLQSLESNSIPSLLVYNHGNLLGIGLNDCVFGFTVVGTIDDQMRNVDAAAKMRGENISGSPHPIGTPQTIIKRITGCVTQDIANGEWIACIVMGIAETAFLGKAVAGGVCLASFTGAPAGCLVVDTPMVQVELTKQQVLSMAPIRSQFTSFDENMCIQVSGVRDGTAICADGTPLKILSHQDEIEFTARMNAIHSLTLKKR